MILHAVGLLGGGLLSIYLWWIWVMIFVYLLVWVSLVMIFLIIQQVFIDFIIFFSLFCVLLDIYWLNVTILYTNYIVIVFVLLLFSQISLFVCQSLDFFFICSYFVLVLGVCFRILLVREFGVVLLLFVLLPPESFLQAAKRIRIPSTMRLFFFVIISFDFMLY